MSELINFQPRSAVLTVGALRLALSEYRDADVVMVEGGGFNDGVVVGRVRTIPHGVRVVIGATESDQMGEDEQQTPKYLCLTCRHPLYEHRESSEWQLLNPRHRRDLSGCTRDDCSCDSADDSHV